MVGRLPQHTDFTLLHHLLVLIEMRSVSRAADRLGIGQPAMSRILARLRDQFADALLVRGPRGMTLTPRAEALSGPLRNWLRDGENLLREPELNLQQVRRSFHLASTDYGALTVLAPTLAQIEREALGIGLTVEPLSDASVRRLEEGQLDLLLTGWDPQGTGLQSRWLFQEDYLGLARADHPVHDARPTADDLLRWPHVATSIGEGFGDWITDERPDMADRRVLCRSESFSLTPYLLAEGEAVAILPRRAARRFASAHGLRTFAVPLGLKPFDYYLSWHERSQDDPTTHWMVATLAAAFEDGDGTSAGQGAEGACSGTGRRAGHSTTTSTSVAPIT
ncbi:DNA-binding transcriptional LysR family regulator [Brevundimonas nasdae]|uniref:LysR family transcriptional regulator n=1 Tax=Brevundimonas nasdae TaxID=172043 RepID=UPI0019124EE3|nr:LysR family transcriptional regulator [Brevundimonas nasdae]MBK6026123.1 LysR family transcriptional regulator [Brevundimonas nasdae]MDQ0452772.1 DNA-binding transcriptional LysR family regulator [Brevundimonas nasdae]